MKLNKEVENELIEIFSEQGFNGSGEDRCFYGEYGEARAVGLPGFHIECNASEKKNIHQLAIESSCNAYSGEIPIVLHRKKYEDWLVTMDLEQFLRIADVIYDSDALGEKDMRVNDMKRLETLTGGDMDKMDRILEIIYGDQT